MLLIFFSCLPGVKEHMSQRQGLFKQLWDLMSFKPTLLGGFICSWLLSYVRYCSLFTFRLTLEKNNRFLCTGFMVKTPSLIIKL